MIHINNDEHDDIDNDHFNHRMLSLQSLYKTNYELHNNKT